VALRARWVALRARWVTLRARWVTLRARWVALRARWVAFTGLLVSPASSLEVAPAAGPERSTETSEPAEGEQAESGESIDERAEDVGPGTPSPREALPPVWPPPPREPSTVPRC
jgi:hypothetical protein